MRKLIWIIAVSLAVGLCAHYLGRQQQAGDPATTVAMSQSAAPQPGKRAIEPGPIEGEQDPVKRFLSLLEDGAYEAAVDLYEAGEDGDPALFAALERAYIQFLRGLLQSGDYATLIAVTDVFRNTWYNDFPTLIYQAAACSHLGDYACAIDAYYGANFYGTDPGNSKRAERRLKVFLEETDTLLSKAQRWQDLIALYAHALQWQPDSASYHLRLAELYLTLGDFALAESELAYVTPSPTLQRRFDGVRKAIDDRAAGIAGIPLQKRGAHYLVDALLNGRPVRLMIDTGASVSALSRTAADRIVEVAGLHYQGQARLSTAGGTVASPVYLADSVAIDRHELHGIEWVVIDYPEPGVDGVLGMNVLSRFEFRIDQQRQLLILQDH